MVIKRPPKHCLQIETLSNRTKDQVKKSMNKVIVSRLAGKDSKSKKSKEKASTKKRQNPVRKARFGNKSETQGEYDDADPNYQNQMDEAISRSK